MIDIVKSGPEAIIKNRKPVAIATDASLADQLSVLGGIDEVGHAFNLPVPAEWAKNIAAKYELNKGEPVHIQVFELLAVLIMLLLRGKDLLDSETAALLWIDNIAAVFALVRGGIKNGLADVITELILDVSEEFGMICYSAYIRSKENIADLFTRSERFESYKAKIQFSLDSSTSCDEALKEVEERIGKKMLKRNKRRAEAIQLLEEGKIEVAKLKMEKKRKREFKVDEEKNRLKKMKRSLNKLD